MPGMREHGATDASGALVKRGRLKAKAKAKADAAGAHS